MDPLDDSAFPPTPTVATASLTFSQLLASAPLPAEPPDPHLFDIDDSANLLVDVEGGEVPSPTLLCALTILRAGPNGRLPQGSLKAA
ncbi:hypothetical protein ONZ45_g15380 [Pleurotus djamor]|nr:hypothetical protein ONZ45_g15380 [Pleurotus djamor]